MADVKLKGAVGDPKRKKKVANNKADILIVRKALRANKFNVAEEGAVDTGLLKAINRVQQKFSVPVPDGVIDPDGTTFKLLNPAYKAALAAEEKAKKAAEKAAAKPVMMREVTYQGKTYHVLPKDWDAFMKGMRQQMAPLVKHLRGVVSDHKKNYDMVFEGYNLQKDFWKNIGSVVIASMTLMDPPDFKMVMKFQAEVETLQKLAKTGTLAEVDRQFKVVAAAQNASHDHLIAHLRRFQLSAKAVVVGSAVVGAISSAAFVAVAAPALVPVAGVTLVQASAISGASIGVIAGASKELAKVPTGQSKGGMSAVTNIVLDGALGAVTSAIPAKMPAGFLDDIAAKLAPKATSYFKFIPKETVTPLLQRVISSAYGQEVVRQFVIQFSTAIHKTASGGKIPSGKDFTAQVTEAVFSVLTAGFFGKLDQASKKYAVESGHTLVKKALPDQLAKVMKSGNYDIPPKVQKEIIEGARNLLHQGFLKEGYKSIVELAGVNDGAGKMVDNAVKDVFGSPKNKKKMEAALQKEISKRKIKPKGKK